MIPLSLFFSGILVESLSILDNGPGRGSSSGWSVVPLPSEIMSLESLTLDLSHKGDFLLINYQAKNEASSLVSISSSSIWEPYLL